MFTTPSQPSTESATTLSHNQHTQQPISYSSSLDPIQEQPSAISNSVAIVERGDLAMNSETVPSSSPGQRPERLLSPYPSRQYSHLPTPQSPNNFANYVQGASYPPDSPISQSAQGSFPSMSSLTGQRTSMQRQYTNANQARIISMPRQTATPESSPFPRTTSHNRYTNASTPQPNRPPSRTELQTPRGSIPFALPETSAPLATAPLLSSPISPPIEQRSQLSSPFMAKLSLDNKSSKPKTPSRSRPQSYTPDAHPMQVDDVFSPSLASSSQDQGNTLLPSAITTPPRSPIQQPKPAAGGEIERIRQSMLEDRLAQFQEAETRRPEYLKRAKRTLSEADPTALAEDENMRQREREAAIGIMESPNKGRRLKLFQETSEESFEESLMAGGYGRYRTADWVRQPQPMLLATPGPAGPSNIVSALEEAEEAPPSEKELKKRKRLAAFREGPQAGPKTKLHPVDLKGRGRVLLDIPADDEPAPEPTPGKKKGGGRRKKKGELSVKEKKALAVAAAESGDILEKPNWPDSEFPWRLRTEEREERAKAEAAEKMRWIERFLERDSDDEDEDEHRAPRQEYNMPPQETPPPPRGRGKMVPLATNPAAARPQARRRRSFFPSDPADARAALLSKKSVRTLSYRQQRRMRQAEDESDEEVVCVCNGRDDGRELVQCDGCETWYHLQCIGIKDIAELGKEEDPWFCHACEEDESSSSSEPELLSEPILVPTVEEPAVSRSYDPPFFQPSLQDSPMPWNPARMPHTPTRSSRLADEGHVFSSGSSWVESSRHGPSTPPPLPSGIRVYTNDTPGSFDAYSHNYDESPFDPTSTPSRGIKFGAPFATPKNNVWSMRANGLFQTPSKTGGGRSALNNKTFGGPGTLASALDDSGGGVSPYHRMDPDDESPIRRIRASEGPKARRVMDSPLASRSMGSTSHNLFDESPIMRYKETEGRHDIGHGSLRTNASTEHNVDSI
ncbi:hypothetical protein Hypma_015003 [Hypsizygus marmoreus]|uniref:PHD-type domain-containing protein n=1 Tax=Hypsizygus marmoreus TaxID=39966 RepID=A0A369KCB4_HYPMA|nr:hypothetical protein Hypma_015003 [Hypsizygus marmoreus]